MLARQTLEGQFDIGEALELHLQAQTILHPGRLLRITRQIRHGPKFANLASQLPAVLVFVPCRNLRSATTSRPRVPVGLGR